MTVKRNHKKKKDTLEPRTHSMLPSNPRLLFQCNIFRAFSWWFSRSDTFLTCLTAYRGLVAAIWRRYEGEKAKKKALEIKTSRADQERLPALSCVAAFGILA